MRFKLLSVILSVLVIAKATQIQFEDNGDSDIPLLETIEADEDDSITVSTTTEDKEGPGTIVSTTTEDKEGPGTIVSTTTEDKEGPGTVVSTTTEDKEGPGTIVSTTTEDKEGPSTIVSTTTEDKESSSTTVSTTTEDKESSSTTVSTTTEDKEGSSTTVSTTTEDKEGSSTTVSTTTEDKEGSSTTVSTTTEDKESSSTTVSTTTEPTKGSENYPISVPNKDGKAPCIFSKMNITLRVTYEKMNNKNGTVSLLVPNNTETDGDCGETESTMILSWSVSTVFGNQYIRTLYDVYADENKLTFHFKKNGTIFSVDKIDMDIILDEDNFPLAKEKRLQRTTRENLNLFAASANNSKYVCNEETVVLMEDGGIELSLKDVDLIAFNEDTDITSRSEVNCNQTEASGSTEASVSTEATESADVGAIVGGIIGALAIVGIIGFIIWRRRKNSYAHSEVP